MSWWALFVSVGRDERRIRRRTVVRLVSVQVWMRAVAHRRRWRVQVSSVLVVVVAVVGVVVVLPEPLHVQGPLHVVAFFRCTKMRPVFVLSCCVTTKRVFLAFIA